MTYPILGSIISLCGGSFVPRNPAYILDAPMDIPQNQAGDRPEIEVTEEMERAGVRVLDSFESDYWMPSRSVAVAEIYRAMRSLDRG